jgi:hypothetical protein
MPVLRKIPAVLSTRNRFIILVLRNNPIAAAETPALAALRHAPRKRDASCGSDASSADTPSPTREPADFASRAMRQNAAPAKLPPTTASTSADTRGSCRLVAFPPAGRRDRTTACKIDSASWPWASSRQNNRVARSYFGPIDEEGSDNGIDADRSVGVGVVIPPAAG